MIVAIYTKIFKKTIYKREILCYNNQRPLTEGSVWPCSVWIFILAWLVLFTRTLLGFGK